MIKSRRPSKYYRWLLRSKNHMQGFNDWLVDNGFDVLSKDGLSGGEVIKFVSSSKTGILYETGFANTVCIDLITRYLGERND